MEIWLKRTRFEPILHYSTFIEIFRFQSFYRRLGERFFPPKNTRKTVLQRLSRKTTLFTLGNHPITPNPKNTVFIRNPLETTVLEAPWLFLKMMKKPLFYFTNLHNTEKDRAFWKPISPEYPLFLPTFQNAKISIPNETPLNGHIFEQSLWRALNTIFYRLPRVKSEISIFYFFENFMLFCNETPLNGLSILFYLIYKNSKKWSFLPIFPNFSIINHKKSPFFQKVSYF